MSFKAKDLHYEKQEPAFLRRLKGAYDANDGRSNVQIARPKKDRLKTGDGDDDEPLILDENGEVVGKKEFDGMINGHDKTKDDENKAKDSNGTISSTDLEAEQRREEKQQVASIGGIGRKRKQVKAVGGGSEDEAEGGDDSTRNSKLSQSKSKTKMNKPEKDDKSNIAVKKPSTDKTKKRAKKIKLSFDDPE